MYSASFTPMSFSTPIGIFRDAFERNFGWRIDHILATSVMAARCRTAEVDMSPRKVAGASDHTIVWAEFEYRLREPVDLRSVPSNRAEDS
jgi:endonuclease/exonuclease/phosphatase family metal-dependent hydrolase